jgi:hypothetical protein
MDNESDNNNAGSDKPPLEPDRSEKGGQEKAEGANKELNRPQESEKTDGPPDEKCKCNCACKCKFKEEVKTPEAEQPLMGNREVLMDKYFSKSINDREFRYKVFLRLNAVGTAAKPIRFENVRFDHSIFDACYIRDCVFDSCIFVGCRFLNSNLHSSKFIGCKFDYATFDKTFVDADLLDREAPWQENLKMRFARSLRMNFQQLGDAEAVNKAISLELSATEQHLYKSWASSETYYVMKYPGVKKIGRFGLWLKFKVLDFIWGNGESLIKLVRTLFLAILAVAFGDTFFYGDPYSLHDYFSSFLLSPAVFFGVVTKSEYPPIYISLIAATRLTLFALFTAILVKRFSRR